MITQASEGSVENINNVLKKDLDFGIAQSCFMSLVWKDYQGWVDEPQKNLRAVLSLYTEAVTLIASVDSGIKTPKDLKGKRINIGAEESSDHETSAAIFEMMGLNLKEDMEVSRYSNYEASEKIQSGDIDAFIYTVGHPNLSIIEATNGNRKIRIIPFGQEFINYAQTSKPYLSDTQIDIQYYDKLENNGSVSTVGLKAILFTHIDTKDEVVYRIVKQVVENIELFRRQHPAFAELSAEKMAHDTILPLHPGAESYFKDVGIL